MNFVSNVFCAQARGKKRQSGLFPGNHVKILDRKAPSPASPVTEDVSIMYLSVPREASREMRLARNETLTKNKTRLAKNETRETRSISRELNGTARTLNGCTF